MFGGELLGKCLKKIPPDAAVSSVKKLCHFMMALYIGQYKPIYYHRTSYNHQSTRVLNTVHIVFAMCFL
jgi:hypothetical protein